MAGPTAEHAYEMQISPPAGIGSMATMPKEGGAAVPTSAGITGMAESKAALGQHAWLKRCMKPTKEAEATSSPVPVGGGEAGEVVVEGRGGEERGDVVCREQRGKTCSVRAASRPRCPPQPTPATDPSHRTAKPAPATDPAAGGKASRASSPAMPDSPKVLQ